MSAIILPSISVNNLTSNSSTNYNQRYTFGNKSPEGGTNGLRPSDIVRYKSLTPTSKCKARNRAINVLNNLKIGYTETSILPPHLIREIWQNDANTEHKLYNLAVWEAFDGGSNFRLEEKSRISPETPCSLIHDE